MFTFDGSRLEERLSNLGTKKRALFALACAERLFSSYSLQDEKHDGELTVARATLDEMWKSLLRAQTSQHFTYINTAKKYVRGEDAEWNKLNPICDNAIAAVIYACQCIASGDVESARWAAVQAYEASDYVAHTLGSLEFGGAESEERILRSEVVQNELRCQHEDISTIENATCFADAVEIVRSRAQTSGTELAGYAKMLASESS